MSKWNDKFPSERSRRLYNQNRKKVIASATHCNICGRPLHQELRKPHPLSTECDHIIPISKGGDPCSLENLQAVHRFCNIRKSNKVKEVIAEDKEESFNYLLWQNA